MLRLPLGLSIFISAVRVDRSDADWLWDPCEHLKQGRCEQKLATAGMEKVSTAFQCWAHNFILVYPIFSSCGCFLYLFTEADSGFFQINLISFLSFFCSHWRFYWMATLSSGVQAEPLSPLVTLFLILWLLCWNAELHGLLLASLPSNSFFLLLPEWSF